MVITTGGTGITGRDVTPEAFDRVLEKRIEGFWRAVPDDQLRQDRHIDDPVPRHRRRRVQGTYLFALPGSTGAVKDGWDEILVWQLDSRHGPCNLVELMPRLQEHLKASA